MKYRIYAMIRVPMHTTVEFDGPLSKQEAKLLLGRQAQEWTAVDEAEFCDLGSANRDEVYQVSGFCPKCGGELLVDAERDGCHWPACNPTGAAG